jgi:hypothetical protein
MSDTEFKRRFLKDLEKLDGSLGDAQDELRSTRRKLDDTTRRYRRFTHFVVLAFVVLAASCLWLAYQARERSRDSQDLSARIQRERAKATFNNCADQNARHDRTVRKLRMIVAAIPDRDQRRKARRGVGTTVGLIDALAPRQDCAALVRERVGPPR